MGLLLPVRATQHFWLALRRGTQSRASRCRLEDQAVNSTRRQVRKRSTGAPTYLDLQGVGGVHRQAPPPLVWAIRVPVSVRLELGQSAGCRRDSPGVLCRIKADRVAR